jgi:hypothetical protein
MTTNLKIKKSKRDVLYQFLGDVLRVEFCAELELQWRLLLDFLVHHLQISEKPVNLSPALTFKLSIAV